MKPDRNDTSIVVGLAEPEPEVAEPDTIEIEFKNGVPQPETKPAGETDGRRMKMVFIVRGDLKMRSGKVGAQCAHAMHLYNRMLRTGEYPEHEALEKEWFDRFNQRKVVLAVNSEADLIAIHDMGVESNLATFLIRDSGKTEFHGVPTYTVVSIGPDHDDRIDPITGEESEFWLQGKLRPY